MGGGGGADGSARRVLVAHGLIGIIADVDGGLTLRLLNA